MAAKALKAFAWLGAALGSALVLFLLSAWIGSSLPRIPGWREPAGPLVHNV